MGRHSKHVSVSDFCSRYIPALSRQAVYAAVKQGKLDMHKGKIVLNEKVYLYEPKAYPNALDKVKNVPPLIEPPNEYK